MRKKRGTDRLMARRMRFLRDQFEATMESYAEDAGVHRFEAGAGILVYLCNEMGFDLTEPIISGFVVRVAKEAKRRAKLRKA